MVDAAKLTLTPEVPAPVELVAVDALVPNPRNARRHPASQVRRLVALIERFGFRNPILLGPGNVIVAGHGRWLAAKQLGLAQVPCIRLDGMSDEERQAYMIADNRSAELAEWDDEALAAELVTLRATGFDLDPLGFDDDDLDRMLAEAAEAAGLAVEEGSGAPAPAKRRKRKASDKRALRAQLAGLATRLDECFDTLSPPTPNAELVPTVRETVATLKRLARELAR